MKNDIRRFITHDKGPDALFTTMIDLFAIHSNFPMLQEAERLRRNPRERDEFLEDAFATDIDYRRFIPYIQLHEYEAYLFSDPSHFEFHYDQSEKEIGALQAIANKYSTPELINDGQHSAPSKRIISQFPDYADRKVRIGPVVAERIGLPVIRARCPHFDAWLTRLESA